MRQLRISCREIASILSISAKILNYNPAIKRNKSYFKAECYVTYLVGKEKTAHKD